jgi:uncharacterized protein
MRKLIIGSLLICVFFWVGVAQTPNHGAPAAPKPAFSFQQVMVPMRDGIRLQTVILRPIAESGPLPILLQRTPYGVPDRAPLTPPLYLKELAQDGYIFVFQNLRGRFQSEGTFQLSSWVDLNDPKATNETTDAYDTIDWLVKTCPETTAAWASSVSLIWGSPPA